MSMPSVHKPKILDLLVAAIARRVKRVVVDTTAALAQQQHASHARGFEALSIAQEVFNVSLLQAFGVAAVIICEPMTTDLA